jgi:hypothetical protein
MTLPKAGATYIQERVGINAVAVEAARMNAIWRETTTGDVGVDGTLEFVSVDGYATGRLVAVQVKCGPSFFRAEDGAAWKFYPEEKHRQYWERLPIPVMLVLHDPDTKRSYWTDVRQALRTPDRTGAERRHIAVPKTPLLSQVSAIDLFESAGVSGQAYIDELDLVLKLMVRTRHNNASFPVSYFDLFTQGLTNIARSLYFGMDLAQSAAEFNMERAGGLQLLGVGFEEHEFLFGYVKFLVAQHIAYVDFADCMIDWYDRDMQPHFVAPLTPRGRQLVELVSATEDRLIAGGQISDGGGYRVAQEGFFVMQPESYFRRLPRIAEFQSAVRRSGWPSPSARGENGVNGELLAIPEATEDLEVGVAEKAVKVLFQTLGRWTGKQVVRPRRFQ